MILLLVVAAQVFYFMSLNVPKTIINDGIQGKSFPKDSTGKVLSDGTIHFFSIDIPLPDFLASSGNLHLFDGIDLGRLPYLYALCLIFLAMVLINGMFKKSINTQKGRMGERMLRRLRFELYDRILQFPLNHFRKVKQAEIATMIKDEVEPLGGFIGDAFVQPVFLGGQALTALLFIMLQSVWLGMIVVVVLAAQAFIIPKLRRRVLVLGKQRQLTARTLAGRIAETVDGINEVHVNASSNWERADIAERLGTIFKIRFELYQRKFTAKFINNLLAQTTPFLIYVIGGYLAVTGQMDVGSVVGVLLAYKDLPAPVKELIDWDQQRQDVQIKYEQVIEQFNPDGMIPAEMQAVPEQAPAKLQGELALQAVAAGDDSGAKLLDGVSLVMPLARSVAVVGAGAGGKDALAQVAARLLRPNSGKVNLGGMSLFDLPEAVTGARVAYVGQDVYLFPLSVRDNILYGLKQRPVAPANYDEAARRHRDIFVNESRRSGNPDLDPAADWVDYQAAGATGPQDIDARIVEILRTVEFEEDVYQMGLRGTIQAAARQAVAAAILKARAELHSRLADPGLAALVEPFDRDRYNKNMSLAENLLFGTPIDRGFDPDNIAGNPLVLKTLAEVGLIDDLTAMGAKIAETMVELFADLPAGHPFFEQFSFISAEDLPLFRQMLTRLGGKSVDTLAPADRERLLALPFRYIEARHRLGLIDSTLQEKLLRARQLFAQSLPDDMAGAIEFYDRASYNSAATIQDNILFGRLVYGQAQSSDRIGKLIHEVLDGLQLRQAVTEVGLDYNVGNAGKRLSPVQRQKVGLARGLIKRADLLIINEAIAVMDSSSQQRLRDSVLAASAGRGVLWSLGRASLADAFDEVIVMQSGRVVGRGAPAELASKDKSFADLLAIG